MGGVSDTMTGWEMSGNVKRVLSAILQDDPETLATNGLFRINLLPTICHLIP